MGSREWGMRNREWGTESKFLIPTPHSPFPIPYFLLKNFLTLF